MEFTQEELNQIAYALEYLHDADLCEYGEENIRILEELLTKFGIHYTSQIS